MYCTNTLAVVFCLLLLNSCKESNVTTSSNSEAWKLVSMQSGMVAYSEKEETLTMSQTYTFKADETFTKTQTSEGKTLTGSGTFTTAAAEDGIFYTLAYYQRNEIVGSCAGRDSENLLLRTDGKLQNSWRMCDGPLLVYEKIAGSR